MLKDFLDENLVETNVAVSSPEEAVRHVGELLLNEEYITPNYIEAMIDNLEENGPYFVIAPGIAMPHARPEAGVNQAGLAIITLKEPVKFNHPDNDPVSVVIGLCATDHSTHLEALAGLMERLIEDDTHQKITEVETRKELMELLTQGDETIDD